MMKLSIVLATRNEEGNIGACLDAVKDIANEIIVVDEYSTDNTVKIAKSYGAKVYQHAHEAIFHITKQRAVDYAIGDWILQLDADEIVTNELAKEILGVINSSNEELRILRDKILSSHYLFVRHQLIIENRDGKIGKENGQIDAFFIPRRNLFLGKPLIHAGVYPDAVIRLFKNGKAHFPAKSVHEQITVDGEVSWLTSDLLHNDSPTLRRYFDRLNRYTDLQAENIREAGVKKNIFQLLNYTIIQPFRIFLKLFIRHKGFLDGYGGFMWSLLSATHYPIAYYKYWTNKHD